LFLADKAGLDYDQLLSFTFAYAAVEAVFPALS
jgi:hypothetical protein